MSQEANNSKIRTRLAEMLADEPLSRRAARDLMEREEFSGEELEQALADVDWMMQAKAAHQEEEQRQGEAMVPAAVRSSLLARGFTRGEAEAVLAGDDGSAFLLPFLGRVAQGGMLPSQAMYRQLGKIGFTEKQISDAVERAGIDPKAILRSTIADVLHYGISRRHLQRLLELNGASRQEARAAIREAKPDWEKQAALAAESAAVEAASPDAVAQALRESQFTDAEIRAGLEAAMPGSLEAACRSAQAYIDYEGVSLDFLQQTLEEIGYLPELVESAILELEADQLDWTEAGARAISRRLQESDNPAGGREQVAHALRHFGYDDQQIERGLERAGIDWVKRAVREFRERNEEGPIMMDSPRSAIHALEKMQYTPGEAREAARVLFNNQDEAQAALTEVRSCIWACGRSALEEGLLQAEYAPDIVADTLEHVYFDWNERAEDALEEIYTDIEERFGAPSPVWVRQILQQRGFEPDQIEHAFAHFQGDWRDAAKKYAELARENGGDVDVRSILKEAQFLPEVIDAVLGMADAQDAQTLRQESE